MKFGQHLERESVPEWNLHNLDYNSLKHEIKVHTTRDQATAMTIPGHKDEALTRFEQGLYMELCRQHERLQLFVCSKADEISRRLDHLSKNINRWVTKSHDENVPNDALKYQRRYAKYERELLRCGGDIQALQRFVRVQCVAFRKILKKYKKWTGSTTLTARFAETILADPQSFTRRDLSYLQDRFDEINRDLQHSAPVLSEPSSPDSLSQSLPPALSSSSSPYTGNTDSSTNRPQPDFGVLPPPKLNDRVKYWNEYDDGSECGNPDDGYAIYINPDESMNFPGVDYIQGILRKPLDKARCWFKSTRPTEREPLIDPNQPTRNYATNYFSSDSDEEGGYASSDGFPTAGYAAHFALPSVNQQQATRYRERVFFWGAIGSLVASYLLLAIAGILISTGRHKLRIEVDAGVTVGVVASLCSACSALVMTMSRQDPLPLSYRLTVWTSFVVSCLLNGMLLILVVGNAP